MTKEQNANLIRTADEGEDASAVDGIGDSDVDDSLDGREVDLENEILESGNQLEHIFKYNFWTNDQWKYDLSVGL